jgi:16S rRNA U516 pseudouridylate synthase RsuA-like enzyme
VRVRFVNVRLEGLEPGRWRNLTRGELAGLLPDYFERGRPAAAAGDRP